MNLEEFPNAIIYSERFSKAYSNNVPKVDAIMVAEVFAGCSEFRAVEICEVKPQKYILTKKKK